MSVQPAPRKVVMTFKTDGDTTIDAQGFTGNSCSLETRDYEMVLTGGGGVTSDKKKPDFYAMNPGTNRQSI